MRVEEITMLVRCILCGHPCRRGVEVVNGLGDEGLACKGCLRRSRRTVDSYPK